MSKQIKKSAKSIQGKRVPKTKEQLKDEMKFQQKVTHLKEVVTQLFPVLEKVDTIYDAQTVVNALSGFITAHVEKKVVEIKLKEIEIDLSAEEDSKIKSAIMELIAMFPEESAQELSENLERLGSVFSKFAADKFLKQPMSELKVTDIVAK